MLEYDSDYHLHCQLRLRSGRTITLETLDQQMTYAGRVAGVPNAMVNDMTIDRALTEARSERYRLGRPEPYLIPPSRRDYMREPGDMKEFPLPSWTPEWLPMVRCIALFECVEPISFLIVVWFQDEFAMPIQPPVLDALRDLDWDRLATECEGD